MTAKEADQKMRANGATYPEIAKDLAVDGFKSPRTGKAYTKEGVVFLCRDMPRKKAATIAGASRKRKEFETIIAAAPASQEKQMIMVMGSPAQLRAMMKEHL